MEEKLGMEAVAGISGGTKVEKRVQKRMDSICVPEQPNRFNRSDSDSHPIISLADVGISTSGEPNLRRSTLFSKIFHFPPETELSGHGRLRGRLSESVRMQPADEDDLKRGKFMIHPYSHFKFFWDSGISFIILFTVLTLPVTIAFYSEEQLESGWIAINIIVDFLFMLDIIVAIRSGRVSQKVPDKVIMNPKKIARLYLMKWFTVDLISSLPIDYIILGIILLVEDRPITSNNFIYIRVIRLFGLLKLLRVSRIIRNSQASGTLFLQLFKFAAGLLRILKLVMVMIILTHWNGCIQFLVPVLQGIPEDSWIGINNLQNVSKFEQYSWALFKASSHMLSIGFGRFPPQNLTDVWLTMSSMVIGATFYALFIGNVSALLLSTDSSGRLYDEKLNQVDEYMRYRKIPPSIRSKVHKYFDYRYRRKYFEEDVILQSLSKGLRESIISFNYRQLIQNTPLFQNANEAFVTAVLIRLNVEVFLPNEIIIESGSVGDRMYFIARGKVEIISQENTVNILEDGSYFGEICLLGKEQRRTATVKSLTPCDLCSLTKTDFEQIIAEFPDVREVFETKAFRRLYRLKSMATSDVGSIHSNRTYRKNVNKSSC